MMKKFASCLLGVLALSACAATKSDTAASVPAEEKTVAVPAKKTTAPKSAVKKQAKKPVLKKKKTAVSQKQPEISLQEQFDALMKDVQKTKPNDSLFIAMDCAGYLQKEIVLDGVTTEKPLKFNALLGYVFQKAEDRSSKARITCTSNDESDVIYETTLPDSAPRGVGFEITEKNKMSVTGLMRDGKFLPCKANACSAVFFKEMAEIK